jgi:hypothetical protein
VEAFYGVNRELESPDLLKQGWKATRAALAAVKIKLMC